MQPTTGLSGFRTEIADFGTIYLQLFGEISNRAACSRPQLALPETVDARLHIRYRTVRPSDLPQMPASIAGGTFVRLTGQGRHAAAAYSSASPLDRDNSMNFCLRGANPGNVMFGGNPAAITMRVAVTRQGKMTLDAKAGDCP
jgi:hypothetical protein